MKLTGIPSPGKYSNSQSLRVDAAKAISFVEISASKAAGGVNNSASLLYNFFTACAAAVTSLRDVTAPTFVSAAIAAAAPTKLVITLSEDLDPGVVPAGTAFVSSPAKTFSKVEIAGRKITLTASTAFAAGATTIAYTKPATNTVRDLADIELATFTAQSVTNGVV